MVLKVIWHNTLLYNRFGLDIWGNSVLGLLGNTVAGSLFNIWDMQSDIFRKQNRLRYIYSIDNYNVFNRRKRVPRWFLVRRISSLFYLTLSYSQFSNLALFASNCEGSWESSFIMLVENSVLGMLYRIQVSMNVFELSWFVLLGNVLVNNRSVTYCNASVSYFDVLSISSISISDCVQNSIVESINANSIYFNIPRYLFVSYNYMFAFVYNEPKQMDLAFPNNAVEIYRSADYS